MGNTYWPDTIDLPEPYTHGYTKNIDGSIMEATNWNPSWGYTAGILISKFSDMKEWARIVAEGTLLSEQMKAERFKWVDNHYGFCVMKAGYNSHVFYNTVKKITIVILTNMDSGTPVEYFSQEFRKILDE